MYTINNYCSSSQVIFLFYNAAISLELREGLKRYKCKQFFKEQAHKRIHIRIKYLQIQVEFYIAVFRIKQNEFDYITFR